MLIALRLGHRGEDLTNRLLSLLVGNAAGADDSMPTAAVMTQQFADIYVGSRVENIIANRNARRVFSLFVISDLDLNIALREQSEDQKPIAIRDLLDAAHVHIDHVTFKRRSCEQYFS